nr:helicase [Actinomycetota bacterium]
AWRALRRLTAPADPVTPLGLWKAAALLASGFRALFNRPEVTSVLDALLGDDEDNYWRSVLAYCRDGNLQAVVDEYLHHLTDGQGLDPHTDAGLYELAFEARRALTIRPARYLAADSDHPKGEGIAFLSRFALRYGGLRQEQDDLRLPEVRAAFNSPFWPFVLATTSIGQEGVDFHWWCRAIVHWNLPSNPVDFEQREGRVDRYKGHAIRINVAARHRQSALQSSHHDIWSAAFEGATSDRDRSLGDLAPYWVYAGPAKVERHILGYPLSRDARQWEQLRDRIALYRLAYGQPRQDDLVDLLARHGVGDDPRRTEELRLDLRPPGVLFR